MTLALNKRYFQFIALKYLKSFIVLLIGLSFAVTTIDFLQNMHKIKGGINHKILYAFYTWEYMLALIYPLIILFALAWSQVKFIRENIFVSLYSFGYTKKEIFRPFIFVALFIYISFLLIQNTNFAYARANASEILHNSNIQKRVNNIFIKYNDNFVYIDKLEPIKQIVKDLTLYHIYKDSIDTIVVAKVARYSSGKWIAPYATIYKKVFNKKREIIGFNRYRVKNYPLLKGYQPKVVKLIFEGRSLRLIDGFRAWRLLAKQRLNSSNIRATLYNMLLMPLFALSLMPILFFKIRPYRRFVKIEYIWVKTLGFSLLVWAFFFAMYRLGASGTIDPNIGQLLPTLLLIISSLIFYKRVS